MNGRGELRALTGARGIAAWLVVLFHIRGSIAGLPPAAEQVLAKGYLAVDFFFLLSGFVIWLSWHERLRDPAAVPHFLLKRVARVWPLHLVMLAAAAGLSALLVLTSHASPHADPWRELPLHVLLLQNWGFTDRLAFNDPAWSISAELAAYLLFPLLVVTTDWRRWPRAALVAAAAAFLAALAIAMRDEPILGADIARFGLPRCLAEFGTGTIVAALWVRGGGLPWPLATATLLLAARAVGMPEPAIVPALFAALLLAVARTAGRPGHPLEGRAIHYLGRISYATYLVHMVGWRAFKLLFVTDPTMVPPTSIALYLVAVLIVSVILYEYLERPAQRWIESLPDRRSATGEPSLMPARRRVPPPARR